MKTKVFSESVSILTEQNRKTNRKLPQVEELQVVRDQLFFSGLSSEVHNLPPETTGAERQHAAGFRSEGAAWFCGESTLSTGDSEVSGGSRRTAVPGLQYPDCSNRTTVPGPQPTADVPVWGPGDLRAPAGGSSRTRRTTTCIQDPEVLGPEVPPPPENSHNPANQPPLSAHHKAAWLALGGTHHLQCSCRPPPTRSDTFTTVSNPQQAKGLRAELHDLLKGAIREVECGNHQAAFYSH